MINQNRNRACSKRVICKKSWCHETGFKPSSKIMLLTVPRWYFFCGSLVFFVPCVSHAFVSVHCCLVITCWERADRLAPVGDVYCISVTFPCGNLGQVWYLIVSFPDLCILSYFKYITSPLIVTLLNWMRTVFCISVITLMSDLVSES